MILLIAAIAQTQATVPSGIGFVENRPPNFVYQQEFYLYRTPTGALDSLYLPFPVTGPGPVSIVVDGEVVIDKPDRKGPKSPLPQKVDLILRDPFGKGQLSPSFSRGKYKGTFLVMRDFSRWIEPQNPGPNSAPHWTVWRLELFAKPGPMAVKGRVTITTPAYAYPYEEESFDTKPSSWGGVFKSDDHVAGKSGYYEAAANYFLEKPGVPTRLPVAGKVSVTLGKPAINQREKKGAGWNVVLFKVDDAAAAAHVAYLIRAEPIQPVAGYSGRFSLKRYPLKPERFTLEGKPLPF